MNLESLAQRCVSVPLRGLSSWKAIAQSEEQLRQQNQRCVSVPLRGLSSWKAFHLTSVCLSTARFSPLAGIKFVESAWLKTGSTDYRVSVPLRGLSSWKVRRLKLIRREDSTEAFRKSLFYPHFSHAY